MVIDLSMRRGKSAIKILKAEKGLDHRLGHSGGLAKRNPPMTAKIGTYCSFRNKVAIDAVPICTAGDVPDSPTGINSE